MVETTPQQTTQQGRDQERALLAAVLRKPGLFPDISETVHADTFGWRAYGEVWRAMERLHSAGMGIDTLTVGDELERMGKLDIFQNSDQTAGQITPGATGRAALADLRKVGEPQNARVYAENILDYSAKYKMAALFSQGHYWATNGRRAADIAGDVSKLMSEIRTPGGRADNHTKTLSEATAIAYDQTDRASRGDDDFVQTGYVDLDKMLCGLSAPDLLILAGRPGTGKTALLASIVKNIYDHQPHKRVVIFTLEMSSEQIAKRLIAQESGICFDKQKTGKLTDEDWPLYNHAIEILDSKKNIYLNDMASISINKMRQVLRKIGDIDLVMVDYLQLATADEPTNKKRAGFENRNLEVGAISRGLKEMAKDFSVPILAAAQLSRAVEQRADKEPQLSDLRESGSIEQDSDIVMFLHREEKDPTQQNVTHLKVAKYRNGPVGTVDLLYRASLTRFENAVSRSISTREPPARGYPNND